MASRILGFGDVVGLMKDFEEVIDKDPPLGRTWELVSEDIGDDHEGQAAKICVEQHKAEILVSIAHQYRNYRDYMMEYWKDHDLPLGKPPGTALTFELNTALRGCGFSGRG